MNGIYLFKFREIPVFVSGWYLLLMAYFFLIGNQSMADGFIFAGVATVSLLVHEFGHGLMAKRFHLEPRILLHGWGGLCAHRPARRDRDDILIVGAGPSAGLLLGLVALGVRMAIEYQLPGWLAQRPYLETTLFYFIAVNFFWSILNLIPMWPLDGGQLFRLFIKQKLSPELTHRITHGTGVVIGVLGVAAGLYFGAFFAAVLAGFIAYGNFNQLRSGGLVQRVKPKRSKRGAELYGQALEAMVVHDWEEAVRLGHMMRQEPLDAEQLGQAWELLVVANTNLGEYEEALAYVDRAPQSDAVIAARDRCVDVLQDEMA